MAGKLIAGNWKMNGLIAQRAAVRIEQRDGAIQALDDARRDGLADLLGRLVEQSLVTVSPDGEGTRYGMLEPVRQYARERLEESAEADAVRRLHAQWCFGLARDHREAATVAAIPS